MLNDADVQVGNVAVTMVGMKIANQEGLMDHPDTGKTLFWASDSHLDLIRVPMFCMVLNILT